MKHLKLYESKTLDDILDKISRSGMGSLTNLEKDFLDKYSRGEHKAAEQSIDNRNTKYKGIMEYDPRKDDQDVYREIGKTFGVEDMNFSDWSDKEIEDGKFGILWDQLYDDDMESFLRRYNLPSETSETPWDKLPKSVVKMFKQHIKDIGMLD
jgi:predicted oxidoreductase (fatty acid repression mutant protein)